MSGSDGENAAIHRHFGSAIYAAADSDEHTVTVETRRTGLVFLVDGVQLLEDESGMPNAILDYPDYERYVTESGREKLTEVYENDD